MDNPALLPPMTQCLGRWVGSSSWASRLSQKLITSAAGHEVIQLAMVRRRRRRRRRHHEHESY